MRINDIVSSLRSAYDDWADLLLNPLFVVKNGPGYRAVSWPGDERPLLPACVMASDVANMADGQEYTFQVTDGSLIQLYYQYDSRGRVLQAANLSYYSSKPMGESIITDLTTDAEEATLSVGTYPFRREAESAEEALPEMSVIEPMHGYAKDGPVGWFRIDYDPAQSRGILHLECHLHLSSFPDARIPVGGLPTPKQFIEFTIASCYPTAYAYHRLGADGGYSDENQISSINEQCLRMGDLAILRHLTHIRIPAAGTRVPQTSSRRR